MWPTTLLMAGVLTACGGGPVPTPAPVPVPGGAGESREAGRPRPVLAPTPAHAGPRNGAVTDADLDALWERQLMLPVEGITRQVLRDNYTAGRANGRIHAALDIAAPRSTPVLAAADCIIGRLFSGPVGGIVIYAYDPEEQFVYYYAHLERYRRGLAVGDRVAKGSVIGYVGTTGNAPKNAPHLHFQVMKRGTGRAWWDGPPINPFSFFASDGLRP
ncbi:M23 family metallopeptidase [Gemmatimonas aurantiaca]|uniref:M23 family metallopeptidase n=1 Tax=Gemmatimonas aurantiaca TaxID=173480 RepID=UPI00301B7390